jgi:hypothetical protein
MGLRVTVGPEGADFCGTNDLAIQGAIEYVATRGGGTVEVGPGTYLLHNSVRLRSHVRLLGSGPETLLQKTPSVTVPLTEDTDWYDNRVTVSDASAFRVGGGVLLDGKCPHSGVPQVTIHTILAIEGNTLILKAQARGGDHPAHVGNFWLGHEPTASTLYSMVTGNWVEDVEVAHLRVDGNRGQCAYLNGNYAGAVYFQDSAGVRLHDLQVGNIDGDGLSFQVAHDVTIERSLFHDATQGIHAGSGAQRPIIRENRIERITSHGLVWCWGVRHGVAEGNAIEDCGSAISIGHRDTDNVMRGNAIRRCRTGLVYRNDPTHQAAHRNIVEDNLFEDIGDGESPGCAIDLAGPVADNVIRRNRFRCTQPGLMQTGLRIGPTAGPVMVEGNVCEGVAVEVEDLREARETG